MTATAVGSDVEVSTFYEQWQPSVGDRVRVVMRDETGAAIDAGRTGTIVSVQPGAPHVLCEVEYDARPDLKQATERQRHAASELVPIEEPAVRVIHSEGQGGEPAVGAGPAWQPTVGDRVVITSGNRAGTITAVDERGDDTRCEVAFDHQPGEPELPQRRDYSVRELTPVGKPSAAALGDNENSPPAE